jgi:hypothetical protein
MKHLTKQDFFRNGYFVKEELRRDEEGAMKEYWFARWFRGDTLMAEVSIVVRLGFIHPGEPPIRYLIYTPAWEKGRVWRVDTGANGQARLTYDHLVPAIPKYVTDWLEDHAAALHHWRLFLLQYHR